MSDEIQTIEAGTVVLGRFEIRERVGRGGFATVWRAHDRLLGKDVALKVLHTAVAGEPAAVEEMKRETLRSRELTHPHIVQTYDFVQDGPIVAIAMEFIDGDTMATLAAGRPNGCFNPPDLAPWMADIADALDYAHSEIGGKKTVVHHDIKPSNFIVDRFGTAKVLDFGISKGTQETRFQHTGEFSVAGTPPYMSPQQLRGQRPSPKDDIYSFGATLYTLLTRKPPFFRGDIPTQILQEIPPPMNARRAELGVEEPPLPLEWEETIACCLAKEPELRPASMVEVAVSLGIREPSTRRRAICPPAALRTPAVPKRDASMPDATLADAAPEKIRSRRTKPTTRRRRSKRGGRIAGAAAAAMLGGAAYLMVTRLESDESAPGAGSAGGVGPEPVEAAAGASIDPRMPLLGMSVPAGRPEAIADPERASREQAEREWAEREARTLRRRQLLGAAVEQAMAEGRWEAAAASLEELDLIAPGDLQVAAWTASVGDQLAVRDLVEAYRTAQEARDADAYGMLWVRLDDEARNAIRDSYADIRMLALSIEDLSARIGEGTATVRLRERITFDLRVVGIQSTDARTVLSLRKTPAGWKIAARETEP